MSINLSINDQCHTDVTLEILKQLIDSSTHFCEIWLNIENGPAICCLKNGEDAFLMYLREVGDSGFYVLSERADDVKLEFELSNGQVDSYPADMTVSFNLAKKALKYFYVCQGMLPEIQWVEA